MLKSAFLISSATSGCGKTTCTIALTSLLKEMGFSVQIFKSGPDYIDTAYHSKISGRPAINLDSWMTSQKTVGQTFYRYCRDADYAIVEGGMGLFDGADTRGGLQGSAADLARILNIPVVIVLDVKACSQTAAATLLGCESYHPDVRVRGAILNGIASPWHLEAITSAIKKSCASAVIAHLPSEGELALPERQLGLVSIHDGGFPEKYLSMLKEKFAAGFDVEALPQYNQTAFPPLQKENRQGVRIRLGVARDEAFCFYYQENLRMLEMAGAQLVYFSPLKDRELPDDLDALYFGGGFPEEFITRLAANKMMLEAVRGFKGKIIAECGGLMYLCREFTSLEGESCSLVGKIPASTRMTDKLQACGYREVTTTADCFWGQAGTTIRGHEFHWSQWQSLPPDNFGIYSTANQEMGYFDGQTLASWFHFHLGSNPDLAKCLITSFSS